MSPLDYLTLAGAALLWIVVALLSVGALLVVVIVIAATIGGIRKSFRDARQPPAPVRPIR